MNMLRFTFEHWRRRCLNADQDPVSTIAELRTLLAEDPGIPESELDKLLADLVCPEIHLMWNKATTAGMHSNPALLISPVVPYRGQQIVVHVDPPGRFRDCFNPDDYLP
ncbi:MAG: hypothetical protein KDA85_17710, partial [Planctomycetaceae bacterium]|nr:hypothetical protein [Planctomycetaceae bacterium]